MLNNSKLIHLFRQSRKYISVFLVLVILLGILPVPIRAKAASDDRDYVIVSMGDSFSAGEGIEPFYHQKPNSTQLDSYVPHEDWLAHRSMKAWGGLLTLGGYTMNEYRYDPDEPKSEYHWFFVAVSGAETEHIAKDRQKKTYSYSYNNSSYTPLDQSNSSKQESSNATDKFDNYVNRTQESPVVTISGTEYLPQQVKVFDTLKELGLKADYITLTLGGNDVGFANVISNASWVTNLFSLNFDYKEDLIKDLQTKIDSFDTRYASDLIQAYKDILDRAGVQAHLIVAGYPQLFYYEPFEGVIATRSILFSSSCREAIDNAVVTFNQKIQHLIEVLNEDAIYEGRISFVDVDGASAFNGIQHGAYSRKPYINPVELLNYQDLLSETISSYSMHPNRKGAEVYADCVQAEIDRLEKIKSTDTVSYELQIEPADSNILDMGLPIKYIGPGSKPYSYYIISEKHVNYSSKPIAGLVFYWDEDDLSCRGSIQMAYESSDHSVLITFDCFPNRVAAIYDANRKLWTELPEYCFWESGGDFYIGQTYATDVRSISYHTYVYDLDGNIIRELLNEEYGVIDGRTFYYGDASGFYDMEYAYDDDATFLYRVYAIDLYTGEERLICTYTMYCSLMASSLVSLQNDGIMIINWNTSKDYFFKFGDTVITTR